MFADVVVWYKAVGRKSGSFLGYITPLYLPLVLFHTTTFFSTFDLSEEP